MDMSSLPVLLALTVAALAFGFLLHRNERLHSTILAATARENNELGAESRLREMLDRWAPTGLAPRRP